MNKNNWASERSKKAAATRKERYGPDVFKTLGSAGGKWPRPKKVDDMPVSEQYEALPSENKKL